MEEDHRWRRELVNSSAACRGSCGSTALKAVFIDGVDVLLYFGTVMLQVGSNKQEQTKDASGVAHLDAVGIPATFRVQVTVLASRRVAIDYGSNHMTLKVLSCTVRP